ncbi:MAG: MerR family transcriptional regulator [Actinobacteria bacterium]|nr:MerR family transcriptional regulator [Actinomycetota bacterium]
MGYTAPQAARITGATPAQLDYWARTGLVVPDGGAYEFRDLVALRVVASLLAAGLSLPRAKRAIGFLVVSGEDVAGLRLVTDGEAVWACRDDGQILDALGRGQLALFVAVDAFADQVEAEVRSFCAERDAFVDALEPGARSATD